MPSDPAYAVAGGSRGPLTGIKVVEIGNLIAGPFASRILGEFGAHIVKIEPREGDPLRKWRVMHNDTSLWWYVQGRNKHSVELDLKTQIGREAARKLIAASDIVIENLRPGAMEKLGLGWDDLSKLNPNLVMVRISGFGQSGPYRGRPGFGAIAEAMGGLRYTTGSEDSPPARVGISIGDTLASLHAVIGALMSLVHLRSGRGRGQIVDVALYESVFNVMESLVPEYDCAGVVRERSGGRLPGICPSNSYLTRDGVWIVIAGNSDAIYRRLMQAVGRADLARDPQLQTNDQRVKQESKIDAAIAEWARQYDLEEALAILAEAEVPSSYIFSVADIVQDPQFLARDMIVPAALPDGTTVKMPGIVPKLSATPGSIRRIGPAIGQDTESVLRDYGFSEIEIEALLPGRGAAHE